MESLLHLVGGIFVLTGSFLLVSGGVGILRFPDFFARMHAVGVTETLATSMIIIGLLFYSTEILVAVKLVIILLMTLFISPSASHALAHAALRNDLILEQEKENQNKAE